MLATLPLPERTRRIFVPFGSEAALAIALRQDGWVTVQGLAAVKDAALEAKRLICSHVLKDGRPAAVTD